MNRLQVYAGLRFLQVAGINPDHSAEVYCGCCGKKFKCSSNGAKSTSWTAVQRHIDEHHPKFSVKDGSSNPIVLAMEAAAAQRGAGAGGGGGGAAASTKEALKATAAAYIQCVAASNLALGLAARAADGPGPQHAYEHHMMAVHPGADVDKLPSFTAYKVAAAMDAAAARSLANTRAHVAQQASKQLRTKGNITGFMRRRYGLQFDKWSDPFRRDVLGIVVVMEEECV
jgi:hypothetical protein